MGVTRTVLKSIPLPELPGWEQRMVLLEWTPGFEAQPHWHPIVGINYVVEGEVLSQWEGEEVERHKTGSVFLDRAIQTHILTGNGLKDKPTKAVAVYVVKIGEPNVIQGKGPEG